MQNKSLEQTAGRLRDLKRALANGADLTTYQDSMNREKFNTLKKVATEIKENRDRVLEAWV